MVVFNFSRCVGNGSADFAIRDIGLEVRLANTTGANATVARLKVVLLVEAPVAQPRNCRELLPRESVLNDRSMASRSPGARATGSFGQARLVDASPAPRSSQ